MVFTVEPGLYFDIDDATVPHALRGLGIRIEDTVVVTPEGVEVLTEGVPKARSELEALRAQAG
jgi:Xaa-Pro aminopeptidase